MYNMAPASSELPAHPELLRRLAGVDFVGAAEKIYKEISARHLYASADCSNTKTTRVNDSIH
jgi:hypothetical protein